LDVDEEMELAMRFGIVSIPTVVCIKNGEVTNKVVGYVPKEQLLEIMG
jgi:thioredoxin 1